MLACAGCDSATSTGRLQLDPDMAWADGRVHIETGILFEPTPPMREALESGVDLRLDVVTRVSRRYGPVALMRDKQVHPVTIHFLPLTEQWQVTVGDEQRTYPHLWLLLDALERPRTYATGLVREQVDDGPWQVQVRAHFNRSELPSPMHLPSLLSADWRLSSRWYTWQIDAS